jgi:hypothetical protein
MHHRALASLLVAAGFGAAACSAADSSGSPVTSHPPAATATTPTPTEVPHVPHAPTGGVAPGTVGPTGSVQNPTSQTPDAGAFDAGPDAPPLVACEGSGWTPPNGANCNSTSNDGSCSTTCMGGTKFWQAQCQDGVCQCMIGLATMCECRMLAGTCKPCCPGMP